MNLAQHSGRPAPPAEGATARTTLVSLGLGRGFFQSRPRRRADGSVVLVARPVLLAIAVAGMWAAVVLSCMFIATMPFVDVVIFMGPVLLVSLLPILPMWRTDRVTVDGAAGSVELRWRRPWGASSVSVSLDEVELILCRTSRNSPRWLQEWLVVIGREPLYIAIARMRREKKAGALLERVSRMTGIPGQSIGPVAWSTTTAPSD